MRSRRLVGFVLACLVGMPGTASAGLSADLFGYAFIPFPLTRWSWNANTLGPARSVQLTPLEAGRSVRWHVTFRAAEGSDFSREGGVLALESAPRECDRLELQVADVEHTSTDDRFIPLRDGRQLDRVPDAEEAAYFVARFQELAKYPRTVAARWNCDAIRERCAGKDVSVFSPAVRETSPGVFESTPGAAATIDCSQIDRSIAVCREWEARSAIEARAVADSPPRPSCKGLLITRRSEGGKSVELRAIGEDGAEWGSVSAAPGLPVRPLAVALAPLTVPADVVLMGVEGLVLGVLALILLPAAR